MAINIVKAVRNGDLTLVRHWINSGGDIHMVYCNGSAEPDMTFLLEAARAGQLDIVEYLYKCGADIEHYDYYNQWTAVRWAAQYGHIDVVNFLCSKGANIDNFTVTPKYLSREMVDCINSIKTARAGARMVKRAR